MEQNQSFLFEDQESIVNDQINNYDRNYHYSSSSMLLPQQELRSQILGRLGLSATNHNIRAPNIHAESSSSRSSRMGYRAFGPRDEFERRITRMNNNNNNNNNKVDYNEILRLVKNGKLSATQIVKLTKDHVHELMVDPIGNTLFRSVLRFCNQTCIDLLLLSLIGKQDLFLSVCLDHLGHKGLVKFMDKLRCPCEQNIIASAISCCVVALAKSTRYGHQLLNYCFLKFPPQANELILLRIAQNCSEIAIDQAGCCILQVCIRYAIDEVREALISPLIQDVEYLSTHPFGNYVIQFMIILDGGNLGARIIKRLRSKFLRLCLDKCGSNVVEKCLLCCDQAYVDGIILEIMDNDYNQLQLCTNEYGNFVVQKALCVAKGGSYNFLIRAIGNHRFDLQFHPYGKHVTAALDFLLKESKLCFFAHNLSHSRSESSI